MHCDARNIKETHIQTSYQSQKESMFSKPFETRILAVKALCIQFQNNQQVTTLFSFSPTSRNGDSTLIADTKELNIPIIRQLS
jgi:hypothetical protein